MGVYTDGIHLVADTEEELHKFAEAIGLKRTWFQDHRHPHYDVFGITVNKAIMAGAKLKDSKFLVKLKLTRDAREQMNLVDAL